LKFIFILPAGVVIDVIRDSFDETKIGPCSLYMEVWVVHYMP
jgi:hypothetical protein